MSTSQVMLPRLLRTGTRASRIRRADMCFFLTTPFAQALSPIPFLLYFLSAWAGATLPAWAWAAAAALGLSYAGSCLLAAVLRLAAGQKIRLSGLLLFPVFMASFVPLQVLSLLRRTTEWKVIRHSRSIEYAPQMAVR